jgi:uncharacterized membrane protein
MAKAPKATATAARPQAGRIVQGLISRPILTSAVGIGAFVGVLLTVIPNPLIPATRSIIAWDFGCLWFSVLMLNTMGDKKAVDIERRAALQDEGRHFILALVLVAVVASLAAVAAELTLAKNAHGLTKALHVALAFATVALSWFLVQLIFALHYAHEYYLPGETGPSCRRGLDFPKDDAPDYWDFLYFSLVIGVAAQTADVDFTAKTTRRIGAVQGVISFTFNTIVLALTINLLAGLF